MGYVCCCDSSVNKHDTKHYQGTGHLVTNLINFENRKCCYEDQKCLICLNAEMSSFLPILPNEAFTFNYNDKRGVELEFRPRKKE